MLLRLELIREAHSSLDLQYYIFHGDESGRLVTEALSEAAQRGVISGEGGDWHGSGLQVEHATLGGGRRWVGRDAAGTVGLIGPGAVAVEDEQQVIEERKLLVHERTVEGVLALG